MVSNLPRSVSGRDPGSARAFLPDSNMSTMLRPWPRKKTAWGCRSAVFERWLLVFEYIHSVREIY